MQIRQIPNFIYRHLGWLLPLFIIIWFLWKGSFTPVSGWLPWFWGSMTGCAVMLLVWQIFCLIRGLRASADSRMLRLRFLGAIMVLFFCTGAWLFSEAFLYINHKAAYGMAHTIPPINATEGLFRSMMCSLKLFLLDVNGFVFNSISDRPDMRSLITIQAVLSFSCTMVLVVSLITERMRAYIRLRFRTRVSSGKPHLYIFFGINDRTELLARSIRKDNETSSKGNIIFIERARVDSDEGSEWTKIVNMITHKREYFSLARCLDARIALSRISLDETTTISPDEDLFGRLGLQSVRRAILSLNKVQNAKLHIFLLSDDEKSNARGTVLLSHDNLFSPGRMPNVITSIHCRARRDDSSTALTGLGLTRNINVDIIDESRLDTECLRLDSKFHPVNFIETIPGHTFAATPFNSLIVGFGPTGRDAMRFLYEFGSFLSPESEKGIEVRSPFRCMAIDPEMDTLKGRFINSAPEISSKYNPDGSPLMEFKALDPSSCEFISEILPGIAGVLNYVVIATDDDKKNIDTAIDIFKAVRASRTDLSHIKIAVRCGNSLNASYFRQVTTVFSTGFSADPVIETFGSPEQIYTCDLIIRDRLNALAEQFFNNYNRCSNRFIDGTDCQSSPTWTQRRGLLCGHLNRNADGKIVESNPELRTIDIDRFRELARKESQDLSNALHARTKLILLQRIYNHLPKDDQDRFRTEMENLPDPASVIYGPGDDTFPETIKELAMLEHLRWSSAIELLGYTRGPRENHTTDERRRIHHCLVPWENLDEESAAKSSSGIHVDYKLYDLMVIYTTLNMYHQKQLK